MFESNDLSTDLRTHNSFGHPFLIRVRAQLLLCVSIPGSIVSTNRFSSHVVRWLLLCVSITVDLASALALACQPNPVLVENADAC